MHTCGGIERRNSFAFDNIMIGDYCMFVYGQTQSEIVIIEGIGL